MPPSRARPEGPARGASGARRPAAPRGVRRRRRRSAAAAASPASIVVMQGMPARIAAARISKPSVRAPWPPRGVLITRSIAPPGDQVADVRRRPRRSCAPPARRARPPTRAAAVPEVATQRRGRRRARRAARATASRLVGVARRDERAARCAAGPGPRRAGPWRTPRRSCRRGPSPRRSRASPGRAPGRRRRSARRAAPPPSPPRGAAGAAAGSPSSPSEAPSISRTAWRTSGTPVALATNGHGARGARVGLDDVDAPVAHGELHVEQARPRRGPWRGRRSAPRARPPGPGPALWAGSTHAESPEWTPAASTCSITAAVQQSAPSERASTSSSTAFSRKRSTSSTPSGRSRAM